MRMRSRTLLLVLLPLLACSRESQTPATEPTTTQAATSQAPTAAPKAEPSYDRAVVWLKTAPRFSFVLEEEGVRAEGAMTRSRVGAEVVQFSAGGEEWRGEAAAQGLVWKRRAGSRWAEAPPPPFAGRLYQRVTLGFDPQKKEGTAQLASRDGTVSIFRFTDANTGEAWEVRVRDDDSIERINIAGKLDLRITV